MQYVIIGNGPAGVIAAETLRKVDHTGGIVLIGDEPEPPYSRMAIPYLLAEDIDEAGTYLRKGKDHFAAHGIELVTGRAAGVDTKRRRVRLADGTEQPYDRLLIATGSRPVAAPIPGIDSPGVHSCWTLADARGILSRAKKGAKVVQLGAGFIGCIILEALASRGVQLTVVEMGNRMVPRMMTERAGGLIKRWCEEKGVRVVTSARAEAIETSGKGLRVKLSGGESLDADLVISATGVRPCIDFLKDSGIATDTGVLANERMQTSVPEVYVAGDVAQTDEFYTRSRIVNAIQPNAADQGRVAALNMAGRSATFQGALAINVLDTLGLISSSFGQWMGVKGGESVELLDDAAYRYLSLAFDKDKLVGATSLGHTEHVGVLRGLIQAQVHLGEWKDRLLSDPTRFVEAYVACAHAGATRRA